MGHAGFNLVYKITLPLPPTAGARSRSYRFTPRSEDTLIWLVRRIVGRWWPKGIELAPWMTYPYDASSFGIHPHAGNRYRRSPEEMAPFDFPVLSFQVPVVSERAAERLGFHPAALPRAPGARASAARS